MKTRRTQDDLRYDVQEFIGRMQATIDHAQVANDRDPRRAAKRLWRGLQDLGRIIERLSDGAAC